MPLARDSVDYFFYLAPINYELGATDFSWKVVRARDPEQAAG